MPGGSYSPVRLLPGPISVASEGFGHRTWPRSDSFPVEGHTKLPGGPKHTNTGPFYLAQWFKVTMRADLSPPLKTGGPRLSPTRRPTHRGWRMGKGAMALVERKRLHGWTDERRRGKFIRKWNQSTSIPTLLSKDKPEKENFKLAVNVR